MMRFIALFLAAFASLGYSLPQKNAIGQPPVPKPPGAIEPGVSNAEALNKLQQDGTPAPNVTTYVVCVRREPGRAQPISNFLTAEHGKSVKVYGRWLRIHCKDDGIIDAFETQKSMVDDVNNQCKGKGYDFAQPSDDYHLSSYPFLYDDTVTEHFRHSTPFAFNRIPALPSSDCVAVKILP